MRTDTRQWQMPRGRIFQLDPKVVHDHEECWNVFAQGGGDVKLGRSPGWNLERAERSWLWTYAFVEGLQKDQEINDQIDPIANILSDFTLVSSIASVKRVNEYARSHVKIDLDFAPEEITRVLEIPYSRKMLQTSKSDGQDQQRESHYAVRLWRGSVDPRYYLFS